MNVETVRAALSLVERGETFMWATIIASRGSAPRHAGTCMLIERDGSTAGTIGGGPLEAAVLERAVHALVREKSLLMDFDSARLGMLCGGEGLVLIEFVEPARPGVQDLYACLSDLLSKGEGGWVVRAVVRDDDGECRVGTCLVRADGSAAGDPVAPLDQLRELARRGGEDDQVRAAARPAEVFVQQVGARGKAIVFGAGHCGESVVPVLSGLGFFTTIVDDRAGFANAERFPRADRIVVPASFDEVTKYLPVDTDTYLVIVTRGHEHDKSVLRQALKTPARYIGMMGSAKKVAQIFEALRDEGFTPDDLARVHAPIGLPIGAETPEEIAISIAAEMVQCRAGAC